MTKEEFNSKQNKYNVPGYTDDELAIALRVKSIDDIDPETIEVCPVCKAKCVFDQGCSICGFDPYLYDNDRPYKQWLKEFKADFKSRKKLDKTYIWKCVN